MCSKTGNLEHILSSCSKALGKGHHHWKHDQVFKTIVVAMRKGISHKRYAYATARMITFDEGWSEQKESHQ